VSSPVPLLAIQVAVTRRDPGDPAGAQLLPEQAIDLETALRAYTLGSAYAMGLEQETGSITVGKAADLVVLARNLSQVDPGELGKVAVELTMLAGKPVYGDLSTLEPKKAP
jgi:predicted amidohydrolase YtcJ